MPKDRVRKTKLAKGKPYAGKDLDTDVAYAERHADFGEETDEQSYIRPKAAAASTSTSGASSGTAGAQNTTQEQRPWVAVIRVVLVTLVFVLVRIQVIL